MTCFFYPYPLYDSGFPPSALSLHLNYAWFRSADGHIWPLTLHLDPSRVMWGYWPWLNPYISMVSNLALFFVCFLRSWDRIHDFFYIERCIVSLNTIRCQSGSGPLTQFTSAFADSMSAGNCASGLEMAHNPGNEGAPGKVTRFHATLAAVPTKLWLPFLPPLTKIRQFRLFPLVKNLLQCLNCFFFLVK